MNKSLLVLCLMPIFAYAKTDGNGNITSDTFNDANIFNGSSNNNLGDKYDKNGWIYWAQRNHLTNSSYNTIAGWDNKLNGSNGNTLDGSSITLTNSSNNTIGNKNKCRGTANDGSGTQYMECTLSELTVTNSHNNFINGSGYSVVENSDRNDFTMVSSSAKKTYDTKINGNNIHTNNVKDSDINGTWTNATNVINGYTSGIYNEIFNSADSSIKGNYNNLTGDNNSIIGNNNTVFGGNNNLVTGNKNSVDGSQNFINGHNNLVHGTNLGGEVMTVNDSVLYGSDNAGLGDTVTDIKNSVVMGDNSSISTTGTSLTDSISINANGSAGSNVINMGGTVDADNTISIGHGSTASNGAIALGSGANASKANEINVGDRQIKGVLTAQIDSDAINMAQMHTAWDAVAEGTYSYLSNEMENVVNEANDYTDETLNNVVSRSYEYVDNRLSQMHLTDKITQYVDHRFNGVSESIDRNNKRNHAGIAAAMAGSAIPQKPSKLLSFGIGAATYRSEYASALGLTWQVSNRTALKGMLSFDSQSGTGLTAGLAIAF